MIRVNFLYFIIWLPYSSASTTKLVSGYHHFGNETIFSISQLRRQCPTKVVILINMNFKMKEPQGGGIVLITQNFDPT